MSTIPINVPPSKIYVFALKEESTIPGVFDEWASFARNETEALLEIEIRYRIPRSALRLVKVMDDRRRHRERRSR